MAAKCNITKVVLDKLSDLKYGYTPSNDTEQAILENYIQYLNCPTVTLAPCFTDGDCSNQVVIFRCEFNVISMTFYIEEGKPYFNINVGNYVGGKEPFEYFWSFDSEYFEAETPVDEDTIILEVKPGKRLDTLVTAISVVITDANGCQDTKVCYITPDGLKCNNNYEPCPNPIDLLVSNLYVSCAAPSGLIVKKLN